jgi:drug/metabolite transporter (DMT)-like permease
VIFIFLMKGSRIDLSMMSGIILLLLATVTFAIYSVLTRSITKQLALKKLVILWLESDFQFCFSSL